MPCCCEKRETSLFVKAFRVTLDDSEKRPFLDNLKKLKSLHKGRPLHARRGRKKFLWRDVFLASADNSFDSFSSNEEKGVCVRVSAVLEAAESIGNRSKKR